MAKVHLDFGHGGRDPGAIGNGLQEKDIVLLIGLEVGKILERHKVEVSYSRTTDVFLELHERANKANNVGADIFVSIHCNSAENTSARGLETYSYISSAKGVKLATDIQTSIISENIFTANRGIKSANFAVLRLTKMPAALVELGFISNSQDAQILRSKQNEIAVGIAKGILKNLGIKYIEVVDEDKDKVKVKIKGKTHYLDGFLKDETNYVAIRQVSEILGHKVSWDNKSNAVVIE